MARVKARAKATQMARDMAEDRGAPRSAKRAIAPAARGPGFATRHNRLHGEATFLALVALAAGSGATTGGCPGLREFAAVTGRMPTAEWARQAMQARDATGALRHLRASAARQLRALRRRGELHAEIVVALGMHGIHRYGRASPRVAAALRKFAAGKAARVLPMRIPGGRGREAPHAMIIRKRKKSEGRGPEGKHIAFATNMPSVDPDEPCPRRWGIEIGYKLPRHTRMRTPGRSESVRIFCFVMSLMVHNAWTMLHPGRRAAGDSRRIPATSLKFLIMLGVCNVFGVQPRLRPPRKPLP